MISRPSSPSIPPDTNRAARAVLGQNNFYLLVGDNWEALLCPTADEQNRAAAAETPEMPASLVLGTLLQHKEKLSDRQAEEASRLRIEWKYALHLSMVHPGLSRSRLCLFRRQVYQDPACRVEFELALERFMALVATSECAQPALPPLTLLNEICTHSRLEETLLVLRSALEVLAIHHSKWLRDIILPHWYTRYQLFQAAPELPRSHYQQVSFAEAIGSDMRYLAEAIARSDQPELGRLEEIKALQQTWTEQFEPAEDGSGKLQTWCQLCRYALGDNGAHA